MLVFTDDKSRWDDNSSYYIRSGATGPDGRYRIESLIPGRYHVAAYGPDDVLSREFMAEAKRGAAPFTLTIAETKRVNLGLIRFRGHFLKRG